MCCWWRKEGYSAGKDSLEKDPSQNFAHGEFSLQGRELAVVLINRKMPRNDYSSEQATGIPVDAELVVRQRRGHSTALSQKIA